MRETACKCTIFGEKYSFVAGDRKPTNWCYYLCLEFTKFSFYTFFNLRMCLRFYCYSGFFPTKNIHLFFSVVSTNCNHGKTRYLPSCTKSDRDRITLFGWFWCDVGGGEFSTDCDVVVVLVVRGPRTQLWASCHWDPSLCTQQPAPSTT